MQKLKNNAFFDSFSIETASREEVLRMCHFHYRSSTRQPYVAAWKLSHRTLSGDSFCTYPIGIITYAMPLLNCAARRLAAGDFFSVPDKQLRLKRLNRCVRRISRVVIDPRFRGLGLAARLVRMTIPLLNVPMIETVSVMGALSRFFERAGMQRYALPPRPQALNLAEQLNQVGIPETFWTDAAKVRARMNALPDSQKRPLEKALLRFLGPYGRRRQMPDGLERIRFALSRLNARPAYFVWFHPAASLTEFAESHCSPS